MGSERGAILALDGMEIQITKPKRDGMSFYNRKARFSLNFICAVDHKLRFRAVTYGSGSSHDSWVYRISRMREKIESIRYDDIYVVADSAFIGFNKIKITQSNTRNSLTPAQLYSLSRQRIKVENAFGYFKGKFRRFDVKTMNKGV